MKVMLLDADGVVLKKDELFSAKFSREYKVPMETIASFFKNEYSACQLGEKDLKEILPVYLKDWGWDKGIDAFLEYWFEDIEINPEIETILERCKKQDIACYMASNNEHYRARAIEKKLADRLAGYFFSADLKLKKNNPEFFHYVTEQLAVAPHEVGFTDNEEQNIEAAREFGIDAQLYREGLFVEWIGPEMPTEFNKVN